MNVSIKAKIMFELAAVLLFCAGFSYMFTTMLAAQRILPVNDVFRYDTMDISVDDHIDHSESIHIKDNHIMISSPDAYIDLKNIQNQVNVMKSLTIDLDWNGKNQDSNVIKIYFAKSGEGFKDNIYLEQQSVRGENIFEVPDFLTGIDTIRIDFSDVQRKHINIEGIYINKEYGFSWIQYFLVFGIFVIIILNDRFVKRKGEV